MILREALDSAVREGIIPKNPADGTSPPKVRRQEKQVLTKDQIETFMKLIEGDEEWYDFFYTEIITGMRQGELLGLAWECVDFQTGIITVKQQLQCKDGNYFLETPKSGKNRTILPAPIVMDALRNQLERQQKEQEQAGKMWDNQFNLVFTDALGKYLVRRTVVKHFKKISQRAGISDDARFHDLRHSFAVSSLYAGDDIKTVQANLGHATAQFTLDVYGHVTQKMRQDSANRMQKFYEQLSSENAQ